MSRRSVGQAWRKSTIALSHQVDSNPQFFRDGMRLAGKHRMRNFRVRNSSS